MVIQFGTIKTSIENSDLKHLNPLPDSCPLCKKSLQPKYILLYKKYDYLHELLCQCPNKECNSLFFAVYSKNEMTHVDNEFYKLNYCYPQSKSYKSFPEEIQQLSPNFIEIYNQAHHADQAELTLICGGAYRKSLEFLLKDYIISEYPNEKETVESITSIQKCINQYIDNSEIKAMAERATWLGNDETHYVRKWEDKDINDLRNLIELTVYFISMKIKAKKYKKEMDR